MKTAYITTTLPYVNSDPHVGFAMEIIRADILARYFAKKGIDVFFNTGTDEHGLKIYRNAQEKGQDTQSYVDGYAQKFKDLIPLLNITPNVHFIRTTDPHHITAAQEFWKRSLANGDLYKKQYSVKYCVGCELEKTESELVQGVCPIHPKTPIEIISEENYFFKFSKYADALLAHYEAHPDFVIPASRFNEIKAFVSRGLEDFSVSRLASKMPWGIPVPGDEEHVMYVWFDALINYISTLGWPENTAQFESYWPVIQYCGKDNLRQQSAMWQAMLFSVGLPASKQIIINGFITAEGGVKMSKSLGNTINPIEIVSRYGADALRFFVTHELAPHEDSPFSDALFAQAYEAYLANGIGNTSSRILKMAHTYDAWDISPRGDEVRTRLETIFESAFEKRNLQDPIKAILAEITLLDKYIQEQKPFELWKTDQGRAKSVVSECVSALSVIATFLEIYLPQTAQSILQAIQNKQAVSPLFPRK